MFPTEMIKLHLDAAYNHPCFYHHPFSIQAEKKFNKSSITKCLAGDSGIDVLC